MELKTKLENDGQAVKYHIFSGTKLLIEGVIAFSNELETSKNIYKIVAKKINMRQLTDIVVVMGGKTIFTGKDFFKPTVAKKLQGRIHPQDVFGK